MFATKEQRAKEPKRSCPIGPLTGRSIARSLARFSIDDDDNDNDRYPLSFSLFSRLLLLALGKTRGWSTEGIATIKNRSRQIIHQHTHRHTHNDDTQWQEGNYVSLKSLESFLFCLCQWHSIKRTTHTHRQKDRKRHTHTSKRDVTEPENAEHSEFKMRKSQPFTIDHLARCWPTSAHFTFVFRLVYFHGVSLFSMTISISYFLFPIQQANRFIVDIVNFFCQTKREYI